MTTPGSRSAQQAYQQQVQNTSAAFRRNAAHQDQLRRRHRGPVGVIRRLFGLVFSLVFIAVAVGILLVILSSAQPDWFDHVTAWFYQVSEYAAHKGGSGELHVRPGRVGP